jgi:hypothetical protein
LIYTLYVPQENYLWVDVDSVLAVKKTALFAVKILRYSKHFAICRASLRERNRRRLTLSESIPNMYADDTNITAYHTNINKVEDELNKDLDILTTISKLRYIIQLKFNTTK